MGLEFVFWFLCLLVGMALLTLNTFQLFSILDLEGDALNSYEASSRINSMVIPEFIMQGVFCFIFLLTSNWILFLMALPITVYHAMLYANGKHLVDVTEIFRNLTFEKNLRYFRAGAYVVLLVVVIIRLVLSAFETLRLREGDDLIHLF